MQTHTYIHTHWKRGIHSSVWWSSIWCDGQMLDGWLEQGIEALALERNRNERELCMMTALEMNVHVFMDYGSIKLCCWTGFTVRVCACTEQAEFGKEGRLLYCTLVVMCVESDWPLINYTPYRDRRDFFFYRLFDQCICTDLMFLVN